MPNSLNQARLLLDALEVSPDVGSSLSTLTSLCSELLRHQEDQELALEALHAALTASQPQGGQEYPHEVVEAAEAIIEILEPIIRDREAGSMYRLSRTEMKDAEALQALRDMDNSGEPWLTLKHSGGDQYSGPISYFLDTYIADGWRLVKINIPQLESRVKTGQEWSMEQMWNAGYWAGRNDEQNICHCEARSEGECACGNYDVKLTPNPYKKD